MEQKEQYSTAPADLNELKARIEERGTDWNEALARLKEATKCKDLATAMRDGWAVEDFWKILTSDSPAPEIKLDSPPTPKAEPDPTPAPQNGHTEAPASFNVKAISPDGFDIMLTLRANDTGELLGRIEKALAWLTSHKFTPTSARNSGGGNSGAPSCPTHGKAMKPSKHGGGWYCPVKIADDDGTGKAVYCKQTAK